MRKKVYEWACWDKGVGGLQLFTEWFKSGVEETPPARGSSGRWCRSVHVCLANLRSPQADVTDAGVSETEARSNRQQTARADQCSWHTYLHSDTSQLSRGWVSVGGQSMASPLLWAVLLASSLLGSSWGWTGKQSDFPISLFIFLVHSSCS